MILTVTLNPAWDVTYRVPRLTRHTSHRVGSVLQRPGGKGLNVARVLHVLGEPALATGLAGGATGALLRAALEIPHDFAEIAGETRRTVTVVDGDATVFNEPGPDVGNSPPILITLSCASAPDEDASTTVAAMIMRRGIQMLIGVLPQRGVRAFKPERRALPMSVRPPLLDPPRLF